MSSLMSRVRSGQSHGPIRRAKEAGRERTCRSSKCCQAAAPTLSRDLGSLPTRQVPHLNPGSGCRCKGGTPVVQRRTPVARFCRNECVAYSWEFRSNAAAHSRNQQHLLDLSTWLIQHGIGFIVLEQAIDTTAPIGRGLSRFGCQQMPKFSDSPIACPRQLDG